MAKPKKRPLIKQALIEDIFSEMTEVVGPKGLLTARDFLYMEGVDLDRYTKAQLEEVRFADNPKVALEKLVREQLSSRKEKSIAANGGHETETEIGV